MSAADGVLADAEWRAPAAATSAESRWMTALGIAGIAVRLLIVATSRGSNDALIWEEHATKALDHGLRWMYANQYGPGIQTFNHPPLMGYWAEMALAVSRSSAKIPFWILMKVPGLAGDIGSCLLLRHLWARHAAGPRALAAYGFSLASILVSSYHCNTDALCAFLCLLCAYLGEDARRPFWSGVALAGALNVKFVPFILIPPALVIHTKWRSWLKFLAGGAIGIIPFLPFLLNGRAEFVRNTISYSPIKDNWGIPFLARLSSENPFFGPTAGRFFDWYVDSGRNIILLLVGGLSAFAFLSRKFNLYELFSLSFIAFLVFAPGFGVQYTVYLCPVLFAASLRWGIRYAFLAGIFIGTVYLSWLGPGYPLTSIFQSWYPWPAPLLGLLAWGYMLKVGYRIIKGALARLPRSGPLLT